MSLSIKDPEADRLARAVAGKTGETLTQAIITALQERLSRIAKSNDELDERVEEVLNIGKHCASLPVKDNRMPDDIMGYNDKGLPT
jgi:antitoxin VapB